MEIGEYIRAYINGNLSVFVISISQNKRQYVNCSNKRKHRED